MQKLSIITINLNNASGLRKTIESVVSQTFLDFEYIVIDGGSTDGSEDVIKEYSDKITFWVSEPDKGIYNAMNKGIEKANGEYCLFLNSGDWLIHEILIEVFSLDVTDDIFYGNTINENQIIENQITSLQGNKTLSFYDFYAGISINHQAAFIKRCLFMKYGLYDESYTIISDWAFFIKAIIFGNASVRYLNTDVSYYDSHGISSTSSSLHLSEEETELKKILPEKILSDYYEFKLLKEEVNLIKNDLNRFEHRFGSIDKLLSIVKIKVSKYMTKIYNTL